MSLFISHIVFISYSHPTKIPFISPLIPFYLHCFHGFPLIPPSSPPSVLPVENLGDLCPPTRSDLQRPDLAEARATGSGLRVSPGAARNWFVREFPWGFHVFSHFPDFLMRIQSLRCSKMFHVVFFFHWSVDAPISSIVPFHYVSEFNNFMLWSPRFWVDWLTRLDG